jgi:hypothetical protein
MKTQLTKRQTLEQKNANEFNKNQFIFYMMNMDILILDRILDDNSVYMKNLSKQQFIYWLSKKFQRVNPLSFFSSYKEKISLDKYPGADVLEFTYITSKIEDGEINIEDSNYDVNDEEFRRNHNVYKITLVLSFKDGKISDAMVPKRTIMLKTAIKFAELN